MKHKIILLGYIAIASALVSCKKLLDIKPKTSLAESEFFTSDAGFQQALNGAYSQLASGNLYGDKLTFGFASALAQNYAVTSTAEAATPLAEVVKLNFASPQVRTHASGIWSSAYTALSSLNKIIENTVVHKAALTDSAYSVTRGEVLGLRALIHFDLLRLFGKEYQANLNAKAIPYVKLVTENAVPPSTTEEVVNLILADLKEAENLMSLKDPIVTRNLRTRRSHMNYYGIKALEARVRIYKGDKEGAKAAALIVVNSAKYPFVTNVDASNTVERDRLYITEQVFMLRTPLSITGTYFKYGIPLDAKLTLSAANFSILYETTTGNSTDIRYAYRLENDGGVLFPSKFWQESGGTLSESRLDQYVPVIRLSEMYYILAETAAIPADGIAYLNIVRENRALLPLNAIGATQAFLSTELLKEYQKEFYGEGQLFFYYKRINAATMQFKAAPTAITPAMYVLPIPDAELQFNPNY